MNAKLSLRLLPILLIVSGAGAMPAFAESPMPDPVAPAVIGRPLDSQWPPRPGARNAATRHDGARGSAGSHAAARQSGAVQAGARHVPGKHVAAKVGGAKKAVASHSARQAPTQQAAAPQIPMQPAHAQPTVARQAAPQPSPALAQDAPALQRQAKQALDDRVDPRMHMGEVGKGVHFARKPLGPGAYFDDGNREAVRKYYTAHPVQDCAVARDGACAPASLSGQWQIGQFLKPGLARPVPKPLLADLPKVPPGHQYVQVAGDVLLIAAGSRMVVDGIAAAAVR